MVGLSTHGRGNHLPSQQFSSNHSRSVMMRRSKRTPLAGALNDAALYTSPVFLSTNAWTERESGRSLVRNHHDDLVILATSLDHKLVRMFTTLERFRYAYCCSALVAKNLTLDRIFKEIVLLSASHSISVHLRTFSSIVLRASAAAQNSAKVSVVVMVSCVDELSIGQDVGQTRRTVTL